MKTTHFDYININMHIIDIRLSYIRHHHIFHIHLLAQQIYTSLERDITKSRIELNTRIDSMYYYYFIHQIKAILLRKGT